ncbi:28S ribosomal protein S21, mitochondrial [Drosophila rhopaloa]|uniref:28S ribosomal protein S21, mitochondrial n=2 Tax=melanogaster group TaxID=32346 RepID=A0A6P4FE32_DRORH|nr:28S ribosomal protein S21, mitochondrial [Drosophila rhopaloa]
MLFRPAVLGFSSGHTVLEMRHVQFLARTVLVQNNNVEEACRLLNRVLGKEELLDQFRRTRFYEKPYQVRRRINFEKCKAIYNEDMNRKIQFVLRKNRVEPFPGCS